MILNIFLNIGDQKTIADAYSELINCYPNDKNAKHKAAGSLGGAVNGHTIVLENGNYKRIR